MRIALDRARASAATISIISAAPSCFCRRTAAAAAPTHPVRHRSLTSLAARPTSSSSPSSPLAAALKASTTTHATAEAFPSLASFASHLRSRCGAASRPRHSPHRRHYSATPFCRQAPWQTNNTTAAPSTTSASAIRPVVGDDFAGTSNIVYQAPPIHAKLKPSILRPTVFALLVSAGAFIWAATETNSDTSKRIEAFKRQGASLFRRSVSSVDLARDRRAEMLDNAKKWLVAQLGTSPDTFSTKTRLYTMAAEWWINKSEAQRTCLALIGIQGIIFLAWRVSPRFMARSFTHYPLSGRSYTLLTSVFSHQSGLHFAFNSLAFYSFGSGAMGYLWQPNRDPGSNVIESTSRYHFLALFIAAGVISSLTSHLYSLMWKLPRALKGTKVPPILPSLGASGSIYATVVVTALAFPDSRVSLMFLPFFTFPIGSGIGAMVLLDAVGLIRGWRFFDHAAHLAGAFTGFLAYYFGGDFFDWLRSVLGSNNGSQERPLRA